MSDDDYRDFRDEFLGAVKQLSDRLQTVADRLETVVKQQAVAEAIAKMSEDRLCKAPNTCLELVPRVDALERLTREFVEQRAEQRGWKRGVYWIIGLGMTVGQIIGFGISMALQVYLQQ